MRCEYKNDKLHGLCEIFYKNEEIINKCWYKKSEIDKLHNKLI